MFVIHLINDLKSSFYLDFFKALKKCEIKHVVFSTYVNKEYSNVNEFENLGIKIFHFRFFNKYLKTLIFFKVFFFAFKHKKQRIVIHSNGTNIEGLIARMLNLLLKIPYIITIRNTDINFNRNARFFKYFYNDILNNSSSIILKTPAYLNYIQPYFLNKIRIIPNGLNNFWFENMSFTPRINKNNDNKFIVLIAADFYCNKNIDMLINSVLKISKMGIGIELKIAGALKGDCVNYYNKIIDNNPTVVKFVGHLQKNELLNFYRQGDIFCLCSSYETFGLVYIEALSQGLPIIYSKGQGIDGWLDLKDFAITPSVENITNCLLGFIHQDIYFPELPESFFENFKWENIALEFLNIYKKTFYVTK